MIERNDIGEESKSSIGVSPNVKELQAKEASHRFYLDVWLKKIHDKEEVYEMVISSYL